jgi:hypothetical protein
MQVYMNNYFIFFQFQFLIIMEFLYWRYVVLLILHQINSYLDYYLIALRCFVYRLELLYSLHFNRSILILSHRYLFDFALHGLPCILSLTGQKRQMC